jgi:uncharacterized protein (DUF736 family)
LESHRGGVCLNVELLLENERSALVVAEPQPSRRDTPIGKIGPGQASAAVEPGCIIAFAIGRIIRAHKTLNLNVKSVKFVAAEGNNNKGPDFRIFSGTTEFGAAWKKKSDKGNDYLSVKLDDLSFPAPIYASLVETEAGDLALIWSRCRIAD